jgi:hypothetical protein
VTTVKMESEAVLRWMEISAAVKKGTEKVEKAKKVKKAKKTRTIVMSRPGHQHRRGGYGLVETLSHSSLLFIRELKTVRIVTNHLLQMPGLQ